MIPPASLPFLILSFNVGVSSIPLSSSYVWFVVLHLEKSRSSVNEYYCVLRNFILLGFQLNKKSCKMLTYQHTRTWIKLRLLLKLIKLLDYFVNATRAILKMFNIKRTFWLRRTDAGHPNLSSSASFTLKFTETISTMETEIEIIFLILK